MRRLSCAIALAAGAGLMLGAPSVARADLFTFTSCHITGGCPSTDFGTVALTQSGTSVNFDVTLNNGNRFVETGSGGGFLFLFNDSLAGSTITNISATLNGSTITIAGGLTGLTNQPPIMADGTGTFTAGVECTVASDCNGGSAPNMNDLHFTVTNATLAQLETGNANGNMFVADILCGSTQTGCSAGLTGPVDVSAVPAPIAGAGLPGLIAACGGLIALARQRRKRLMA